MSVGEALLTARVKMRAAKIESPALDAEILLAYILRIKKESLLTHPEAPLSVKDARRFFALVKRRVKREPIAYLIGKKEFYDLDFTVNRNTLIPRPETETLIESVLKKLPVTDYQLPITIIDIGTGSGAIAVTLAKHLPKATVYATDISSSALRVARKNAARHKVSIIFKNGNLLQPILKSLAARHKQFVITANLPYVPTAEWKTLQPEITRYEPRGAIDGGRDGLKYYRQFFAQLKKLPIISYRSSVTLFFEFDPEETFILRSLIKKSFPRATIEIKKDLAGRNRVLIAQISAS